MATVLIAPFPEQRRLPVAIVGGKVGLLLDLLLRLLLPPLALLFLAVLLLAAQLLRWCRLWSLLWLPLWVLPEFPLSVFPFKLPLPLSQPVVSSVPDRSLTPRF